MVRGLDLTVRGGEVVALIGPNGSGKTTTLLTVAGILPPLGGELQVLGAVVRGGRAYRLARLGLALVPQDRGLFAGLTCRQNLSIVRASRADRRERLLEAEELFPNLRRLMDRRAGSLSGGEQQALALARGLAQHPQLLLVDELSMGLAPKLVDRLLQLLRQRSQEVGMAVLVVEQHTAKALAVADRVVVIRHGEAVLEASAAELREDSGRLEAAYFGQHPGAGRDPEEP